MIRSITAKAAIASGKTLGPLFEGEIRRDRDDGALVELRDHLEEQIGGLTFEQQRVPIEASDVGVLIGQLGPNDTLLDVIRAR